MNDAWWNIDPEAGDLLHQISLPKAEMLAWLDNMHRKAKGLPRKKHSALIARMVRKKWAEIQERNPICASPPFVGLDCIALDDDETIAATRDFLALIPPDTPPGAHFFGGGGDRGTVTASSFLDVEGIRRAGRAMKPAVGE